MTLLDFSNFITARLNQTDATSVTLCKQFIQRRYDMIFGQRNWRDAMKNVAASLTDTATGYLDMPATIDRVVAIRAGGDHILTPIDSPMIMQIDPTAFERSSTPIAYEEFTDETVDPIKRKIRFIPIPVETTALLITGKRPFVQITQDTDTPILRDIDNCLIAFATADMLERQRQYGKAASKIQEASALLQAMIAGDTSDAGWMPRIIPMVESEESFYASDSSFIR